MIKKYIEEVRGRYLEIAYDTDNIKDYCTICHQILPQRDKEKDKYYKQHGNYCPSEDKYHAGFVRGFKEGREVIINED